MFDCPPQQALRYVVDIPAAGGRRFNKGVDTGRGLSAVVGFGHSPTGPTKGHDYRSTPRKQRNLPGAVGQEAQNRTPGCLPLLCRCSNCCTINTAHAGDDPNRDTSSSPLLMAAQIAASSS